MLLELFQLENIEPQGKNYLILDILYRFVGECYRFLPKQHTKKEQKVPNTIQQKETLQRLNRVFDYIETYYQASYYD